MFHYFYNLYAVLVLKYILLSSLSTYRLDEVPSNSKVPKTRINQYVSTHFPSILLPSTNGLSVNYSLKPAVHANEMQRFYIKLNHDGQITWFSPVVVELVCQYNVRYFPYDTQHCMVRLGSWVYNADEINLFSKEVTGWSVINRSTLCRTQ